MMASEKEFGYSLHHIIEALNAGEIIDIRCKDIDYSQSMMKNVEDKYEIGVKMVEDVVERFAKGENLEEGTIPQLEEEKGYYTFMSEAKCTACEEMGIRLVDGEEMRAFLVSCFGGEKSAGLSAVLGDATNEWYESLKG